MSNSRAAYDSAIRATEISEEDRILIRTYVAELEKERNDWWQRWQTEAQRRTTEVNQLVNKIKSHQKVWILWFQNKDGNGRWPYDITTAPHQDYECAYVVPAEDMGGENE
jgi:hypothetical protein